MSKLPIYFFASLPFITLVFAIPFVNKVEPIIWGLPFLLWWIVINVLLTPIWLQIVFLLEKRYKNMHLHVQGKEVSK